MADNGTTDEVYEIEGGSRRSVWHRGEEGDTDDGGKGKGDWAVIT